MFQLKRTLDLNICKKKKKNKKITINFNLKSKTLEVRSMNTTCCSIIVHLQTFFGNIR